MANISDRRKKKSTDRAIDSLGAESRPEPAASITAKEKNSDLSPRQKQILEAVKKHREEKAATRPKFRDGGIGDLQDIPSEEKLHNAAINAGGDGKRPLKSEMVSNFEKYLLKEGAQETKAAELLDRFLESEMPDADAILTAATELRRQFNRGNIEEKPSYPGRRSGINAISFLMTHYGEEIRTGAIGPGQLSLLDKTLYNSLREMLRDRAAMREYFPKEPRLETVNDLFGYLSGSGKVTSPFELRARACAALLNTSIEEAVRFFARMRPERIQRP